MTQESLTAYFTGRGLAVRDARWEEMRQGAFRIHVQLSDGVRLSILAGEYFNCTPRANVGSFFNVEIAVLDPLGGFIHAEGKDDDTDDLEAYVTFARIVEVTDQFAPGAPRLVEQDSDEQDSE